MHAKKGFAYMHCKEKFDYRLLKTECSNSRKNESIKLRKTELDIHILQRAIWLFVLSMI